MSQETADAIAFWIVFSPGLILLSGFILSDILADRSVGKRPKFLDTIGWQKDYPFFLRLIGGLCSCIGGLYLAFIFTSIEFEVALIDALPPWPEAILLIVALVNVLAAVPCFTAGKRSSGRKSDVLNFIGLLLLLIAMIAVVTYQFTTNGIPFFN